MKKNIVTVGGGTGTFVVLTGLKKIPNISLTAVVSTSDDGGSTGRLRDAHGFVPVGDLRQALVALSDESTASLMRDVFTHRFSKGDIKGHNLGNLLLTGLTDMLGDIGHAIEVSSDILRVSGKVVPVCRAPTTLVAELEDGTTLLGEHDIDACLHERSPIKQLSIKEPVLLSASAKSALHNADIIVLGPGDLYTSVLANFAVDGFSEAVRNSKAKVVYIVNLFTRKGQTDNFSAQDHVNEIARYLGKTPDYVLVHKGTLPKNEEKQYAAVGEFPIKDDLDGPNIIRDDFAIIARQKAVGDSLTRSLVRHDPEKIANAIERI